MRHSRWLITSLFALLLSPVWAISQGQGQDSAHPAAVLSKSYTPTLGDMIALSTSSLLTALKTSSDSPTIAVYDRTAQKVAIIVYGSRSTLDGAKESLDRIRAEMQPRSAMIGSLYGVTLKDRDFGYIYYRNGKELVRWEEGKYTVAAE